MMICLPHRVPPPNTAAGTAHSAHSTQPALRPQRATPRVEDNIPADAPTPLNRSMLPPAESASPGTDYGLPAPTCRSLSFRPATAWRALAQSTPSHQPTPPVLSFGTGFLPRLAFTRYYFTSKLYCGSQSSFYCLPPSCKAYPIAILLHDYRAIYAPPPTPLLYAIYHTILMMAISCKGQYPAC